MDGLKGGENKVTALGGRFVQIMTSGGGNGLF
jgi:hypothetical protein